MLEKKIKSRKAQLRGTLRAQAKKLETSRYCRGPARSLVGATRRPCLSLAQPLGAAEAPSSDVRARTEVTVSHPHGQAGPPKEPHSSHFNSWPVGLEGTWPQNLRLRQGQPRTSSVPSSLKRASHTGRCTRQGEGGRHKTEGPQADHELQAGPGGGGVGRGGALPQDPVYPQSGVSAASRRVQVGDMGPPALGPQGNHPATHATHDSAPHQRPHCRNQKQAWYMDSDHVRRPRAGQTGETNVRGLRTLRTHGLLPW